MAIQAELGPPVLPPLPLQPPLKPPSLAVHNNNNYNITNSNHNSNNLSSALLRQSRQHSQQQNHRKNHHRQHVYQQRYPAAYSPYPSIVPYGRPRPSPTTTDTLQGKPLATPRPSTPPGTGPYATLINTTPRTEAPLPHTPVSITPSKTSQRPRQQSPRSAAIPPTPTAAVAQPQQAKEPTARPPPPAHRRIRYHQHHVSRASARSELTSLTSGPLNNSLLQMTSQTPVLTWPQKCVLAMSKERYLASAPSIAHQVFRSYYEDREDAGNWKEDNDEVAAISGLPSPPPDQENDCRFEFHYQNDDNDQIAMATASAPAADPYHHQQHHNQEIAAGNVDAGEISSLSSDEPPNMMNLPPTGNGNDNAAAGEVSSVSSSDNPSPIPLALPVNSETAIPERQQQQQSHQHQRKPSTHRPPPTSALISQLTVGAAVFRIDVRSQRPTILLLKKRAPTAAAPAATGPASGPPSPYQQHHPQHHYNRPFLEQLPRHLLLDNDGNHTHNNDGDNATKRSSCLPPPPVWELPSGRVDDGDYCISDAIARCVKRLTTLNVVRISSMLRETTNTTTAAGNGARSRRDRQNVEYDPLRALPRGAAFTSAGAALAGGSVRFMDEEGWPDLTPPKEKMQLQLNWTVLVANVEDVVLQGVEHEEFVWANWNVLDMLNLTSATREVAKEALEWAGRCSF